MLKELLQKNRSYRRFNEAVCVTEQQLSDLVALTRLCPSAANLQPLRYLLSCDPQRNARIFQYLAWAGYLKGWPGPAEGERPTGYILVLGDTTIGEKFTCDLGIAAQSILLGAVEQGLGGCMIGAFQKQKLREEFNIPTRFDILLVIAIGQPAEEIRLVDKQEGGDIKYWRDEQGVHYVPKRTLNHLILHWPTQSGE
ncbi:MAG: nitroreductase family protein [Desulfuromonadaceae bacterium]|nr:nitroreductase family protein [Desulfuromonadaceae bacterium]